MRELDPWCKSGVPPPPLRTLTWLQAGEDPCQCPAGARASNHNSCLMWHHRASPGEKPPVCDHCGGQAPLWSSPQAQLCAVHTDYPPCEQRTDAQTFPRTPKPTPLQQRPLVERVCRCGKVFAWRAPLAPQELMQEAKECRPCAGCRKRFGPNEQQQVGEGPSMCPQGGQASSPRPRALAQRLYACDECGRAFTRTSSLLQHERIYTGERPYECCECDQAFVRCFGLYRHRRTHSAERRGPARGGPSCWGVRPAATVVRGPRGPHGRPWPGRSCTSAPSAAKPFGLFSHLVEHRRVHKGKKPYTCPECSKAFNQRSNLSRHQRTHSSAKPYARARCARRPSRAAWGCCSTSARTRTSGPTAAPSAVRTSELRQHERLPSGERPFICAACGKAFVCNCSLVPHRRTHTGEWPYACSECGRAFSQGSNLNEHRRRHAGGGAPLPRTSPTC